MSVYEKIRELATNVPVGSPAWDALVKAGEIAKVEEENLFKIQNLPKISYDFKTAETIMFFVVLYARRNRKHENEDCKQALRLMLNKEFQEIGSIISENEKVELKQGKKCHAVKLLWDRFGRDKITLIEAKRVIDVAEAILISEGEMPEPSVE